MSFLGFRGHAEVTIKVEALADRPTNHDVCKAGTKQAEEIFAALLNGSGP